MRNGARRCNEVTKLSTAGREGVNHKVFKNKIWRNSRNFISTITEDQNLAGKSFKFNYKSCTKIF